MRLFASSILLWYFFDIIDSDTNYYNCYPSVTVTTFDDKK